MTYRLIVTGCRDWTDEFVVGLELTAVLQSQVGALLLVHGGCVTGADDIARRWAKQAAVRDLVDQEPHRADWSQGRAAGPIRNHEMASLGADLCLAFWDGISKGTLDMITQAVRYGIPVKIIPKVVRT